MNVWWFIDQNPYLIPHIPFSVGVFGLRLRRKGKVEVMLKVLKWRSSGSGKRALLGKISPEVFGLTNICDTRKHSIRH
jgi:hypothetical protein